MQPDPEHPGQWRRRHRSRGARTSSAPTHSLRPLDTAPRNPASGRGGIPGPPPRGAKEFHQFTLLGPNREGLERLVELTFFAAGAANQGHAQEGKGSSNPKSIQTTTLNDCPRSGRIFAPCLACGVVARHGDYRATRELQTPEPRPSPADPDSLNSSLRVERSRMKVRYGGQTRVMTLPDWLATVIPFTFVRSQRWSSSPRSSRSRSMLTASHWRVSSEQVIDQSTLERSSSRPRDAALSFAYLYSTSTIVCAMNS